MTQAEDPLNKSTVLGLVAMALAVLVIANDFTAFSVALPAMEQDFGSRRHHGPVGHQRLRARLRRADRHRRPPCRHVRPAADLLPRRGHLRHFLDDRRLCAERRRAARLPRG